MLRASQAAPDQIDAAIAKWDLATALASLRPGTATYSPHAIYATAASAKSPLT